MKTLKFLLLLLWMLAFQTGAAQIDLFLDEDEVEEFNVNSEFLMDNYSFMEIADHLKKGEAGPIGNWAGETLEIMTDARFASAPKEYTAAFQVYTKVLKIKAYQAALNKVALSCEERKQVLESFLLYLGTLYLDMYSMDFFNEKKEYTRNEKINVDLGIIDAFTKFTINKYDRVEFANINFDLWEEMNLNCLNDISDTNVTDCDWRSDNLYPYPQTVSMNLSMETLHPVNILALTVELQEQLNALPCNK